MKFLKWSRRNKIVPQLPLSSAVVGVYLSDLSTQQHRSGSALTIVYAALKWLQGFVPLDGTNPIDDSCCRNIVESAKRARVYPVSKKNRYLPILSKKLLTILPQQTLFSLGFAGFFRFNELRSMQCNHIVFSDEFSKILIPRSKTGIYREGNYIAGTVLNTVQSPF